MAVTFNRSVGIFKLLRGQFKTLRYVQVAFIVQVTVGLVLNGQVETTLAMEFALDAGKFLILSMPSLFTTFEECGSGNDVERLHETTRRVFQVRDNEITDRIVIYGAYFRKPD
jgi:hypothetical protein